jgi:hypothetical protein
MKGGSVASDAVVSSVSDGAFAKLNNQFTNLVGGKTKSKLRRSGGMCMICGGSKQNIMKHFDEFDNTGLMRVHNKKGGASSSASPLFNMNYDYTSGMYKPAHGVHIDRALNHEATNIMASESASSFGGFNKVAQYGNMTDLSNGTFVYGGARVSKPTRKPSSKMGKGTNSPKTGSAKTPKKSPSNSKPATTKLGTKAPRRKQT